MLFWIAKRGHPTTAQIIKINIMSSLSVQSGAMSMLYNFDCWLMLTGYFYRRRWQWHKSSNLKAIMEHLRGKSYLEKTETIHSIGSIVDVKVNVVIMVRNTRVSCRILKFRLWHQQSSPCLCDDNKVFLYCPWIRCFIKNNRSENFANFHPIHWNSRTNKLCFI